MPSSPGVVQQAHRWLEENPERDVPRRDLYQTTTLQGNIRFGIMARFASYAKRVIANERDQSS